MDMPPPNATAEPCRARDLGVTARQGVRARDPNTELQKTIPHCIWEHPAFFGMLKIAPVPLHQLASVIWSYQGDT